MKLSLSFSIAFVLLGLSTVKTETTNIGCNFTAGSIYTCELSQITVNSDDVENIIIGGQHLLGRDNSQAKRVEISNANIPLIITQLFTTFPNLEILKVTAGGLVKIQPGAFKSAGKLTEVLFMGNNIASIEANAFLGASNLQQVNLNMN